MWFRASYLVSQSLTASSAEIHLRKCMWLIPAPSLVQGKVLMTYYFLFIAQEEKLWQCDSPGKSLFSQTGPVMLWTQRWIKYGLNPESARGLAKEIVKKTNKALTTWQLLVTWARLGSWKGSRAALTLQGLRSKQELEVKSRLGKLGWRGERRRKRGLVYVRVFGWFKNKQTEKLVKR